MCKSILLYDKDCCDVVQETLLLAYKRLHTLKEDRYFKTWLFRILINQCNTMRSKQKRLVSIDDEALQNISDTSQGYGELYLCIDSLKENFRQIIILHYINGYSVSEIAQLLGIPSGTVKSRLYKAREELRKVYKEVSYA